MKLVNLTPHVINFIDGSEIEPSGYVANIEWVDEEFKKNDLTLVKRIPKINNEEIESILNIIGEDGFGIVSFPVVSAVRGTKLEGRVGSVMMQSRTEKIAFRDKFSI
jgi:hypothetical protein